MKATPSPVRDIPYDELLWLHGAYVGTTWPKNNLGNVRMLDGCWVTDDIRPLDRGYMPGEVPELDLSQQTPCQPEERIRDAATGLAVSVVVCGSIVIWGLMLAFVAWLWRVMGV